MKVRKKEVVLNSWFNKIKRLGINNLEHFYCAENKKMNNEISISIINKCIFLYEGKWVDFIHFIGIFPFIKYD